MRTSVGLERHRHSLRGVLSAVLVGVALMGTADAGVPAREAGLWCDPACGAIVADWGLAAYATIRADNGYQNPLPASRALAAMHLAMHDAINAAAPRYARYVAASGATTQTGPAAADPAVAAIVAAHDVLLGLYPSQQALLAATLDKALLDAGVGPRIEAGKALGAASAAAILAAREDDGADRAEAYVERTAPGYYRFVPGTDFIVAPHWRSLRPFALTAPDQYRVAPPPALASRRYAEHLAEVKATGGTVSATRTADQTAYAAFWYELSDIGWNRVTRIAARGRGLDLWDSARLFALVNVALADGYIAGWDSKVHYDFWRPVTAIRRAGEDGNPATVADAAWEPLLPTPPIQDHPSTHSVLGAAAATVLAAVLGEEVAFTMASPTALPESPVRRFASFADAAEENAESRIHAGLHFRFAIDDGLALGRTIGRHVAGTLLAPLD